MKNPHRRANAKARLHPHRKYPALEVGGVLVFAYFNKAGVLTVSVDLDTTDPRWLRGTCLPMQVTIQGDQVFKDLADEQ